MKIKLTLDEKYKKLVDEIREEDNPYHDAFIKAFPILVTGLAQEWFGRLARRDGIKVIERIHSADEIEWIATKYNWRFKSKKIYARYISSRYAKITFFKRPFADNIMTESEFKKLLEGTGLPFEAFEKVNADD
ncbi:protein of unknown function [Latilactobacillus sakei]|uniref:hypothetical protein n=1 Tax=Latilactobacillus sakei TaxID=1599 RepID=UPI000C6F2139|nr:hypothetical protein [Latilactobacillus sakei]SON66814.1 protein of unknown function [Latilactobacillus sakei]